MSVTMTANYKEIFSTETVEKIDQLLDENFFLDDMLVFIDENNEEDFVAYYEEYVRCGEAIGYDAVDAYIKEQGDVSYIEGCDDRFRGSYNSEADFAEEYYTDLHNVPCALVIDWQATWDTSLRYDFTFCDGYVFSDY